MTITIVSSIQTTFLIQESALSITMIVCGVITFIQAHGFRWFGAKQLLPPSSNPAYTGASLLAAHMGEMPLVYGMTCFSGIIEMLISPAIRWFKYILPEKYIGSIVILIGFEIASVGVTNLFGDFSEMQSLPNIFLGVGLILFILFIQISSRGVFKYFAFLIAIVVGYTIYILINGINTNFSHLFHSTSWVLFPKNNALFNWHFDFNLAILFLIASFISVFKVVGSISVLQRLRNKEQKKLDLKDVSKGNLADGLGTFLCGFFGGTGVNASSTCMALSVETKVANKYIGYVTALFTVLLAFCGKLMVLLLMTPLSTSPK